MKQTKKLLAVAAVALLAVCMLFVYSTFAEKPVSGSKNITIVVVDDAGQATLYQVQTDALCLRQAMEEAEGLHFEYTDGPYGASVHTVNGLRADYTLDGAYWGFFVNGEYCNYGISEQPVEDGDLFRIAYTPA